MSVMKKPKRNIRRRDFDNEENEGEESEETHILTKKATSKSTDLKMKKEKKKHSVLSFEEEWNDADDGEVFQVKKSSHSKKIKKILEKEKDKKKKKDDKSDQNGIEIDVSEKTKEITFSNELTIKIRHNLPLNPVLNGREAEMAEKDGSSSEDEKGAGHKFSHPDHVKQVLKSGKIPDAAMIHAARKRRQQAREMGDFIPIEEKVSKYDSKGSRLVREDEHDMCDDDIRINMQVNTAAIDLERRREAFNAAIEQQGSEESDKGEEEEWEKQQIRKGVTGAQLAAAQQETMYYGYSMPQVPSDMSVGAAVCVEPTLPATPIIPDTVMHTASPQSVANRLKERLQELKEVHRRHTLDRDEKAKELEDLRAECVKIKAEAPTLADRFRFYQDLRGYVTDLVECLDEKVVIISAMEQRLLSLYRRRTSELTSRRRQDMRDQAEELAVSTKNTTPKRDDQQVRRAAEREGRRIRRLKARETKSLQKHAEGMSSDDEVTEMELAMLRTQKEQIEKDARYVFEDALDEFSTVPGVLQRFDLWKRTDRDAYSEAYVHMCLPKALGPLIRLRILFWSPFIEGGLDLDETRWNQQLLLYNIRDNETEDLLREDPDLELVPKCVEKIIIPKLDQLMGAQWDPMSTSQSLALVNVVTKLLQDYPTLGPNSKAFTLLINNIAEKMREAVDNDVFIPIYPRTIMDGRMSAFFQRQFATSVKLLSNIVRWQGLLSDEVICEIALDSLLNRYLLMAIRLSDATDAAVKCHMVGSVLPRVWLHSGHTPSQLMPLLNQTKTIAQQLDVNKPLSRDALEKLSGLLKAAP
uniref:GCF C-terminal domain-containing protein n=2 Tax=Graphocephala atropunctata TaxID=36148 RepID=A0A1B6M7W2_9HEMI